MGRSPSLIVNCISLSGVREVESLATNSRYLKFLLTLAAPVSLPPGVSGLGEKRKMIEILVSSHFWRIEQLILMIIQIIKKKKKIYCIIFDPQISKATFTTAGTCGPIFFVLCNATTDWTIISEFTQLLHHNSALMGVVVRVGLVMRRLKGLSLRSGRNWWWKGVNKCHSLTPSIPQVRPLSKAPNPPTAPRHLSKIWLPTAPGVCSLMCVYTWMG